MANSPFGGLLEGLMAGREQQMRAAQQIADEVFRERQMAEQQLDRKTRQNYQERSLGLQEREQTGRETENIFDLGMSLYKEGTPGAEVANILRARATAQGLDPDAILQGWEALGVSPQFTFKQQQAEARNELYKDKAFAGHVQKIATGLYNSGVPWERALAEAERVATSGYMMAREITGGQGGPGAPPPTAPTAVSSVPGATKPPPVNMTPMDNLLEWAGVLPPPPAPAPSVAAVSPQTVAPGPALGNGLQPAPSGGIGVSPKYEAWNRDVESKTAYRDQLASFLTDKNLRENEKMAVQRQLNAANIALKKAQASYQEAKVRELQTLMPEKIKEIQARVGHLVRQDEIATQRLQLQQERQKLDAGLKTGRITGPAVRQRAMTTESGLLTKKQSLQKERNEWLILKGSYEQLLSQPEPPADPQTGQQDPDVMKQRRIAESALGPLDTSGKRNGPVSARINQINAMGKEIDTLLQQNRKYLQQERTSREVTPGGAPSGGGRKATPSGKVPRVTTPGAQGFYRGDAPKETSRPNRYFESPSGQRDMARKRATGQKFVKSQAKETDAEIMARLRKKFGN